MTLKGYRRRCRLAHRVEYTYRIDARAAASSFGGFFTFWGVGDFFEGIPCSAVGAFALPSWRGRLALCAAVHGDFGRRINRERVFLR